jgi:hypothetical protein
MFTGQAQKHLHLQRIFGRHHHVGHDGGLLTFVSGAGATRILIGKHTFSANLVFQ